MFRKNQRLTDGAGNCVRGCCDHCKQPGNQCQCDLAPPAPVGQVSTPPEYSRPTFQQPIGSLPYRSIDRRPVSSAGQLVPPTVAQLRSESRRPEIGTLSAGNGNRQPATTAHSLTAREPSAPARIPAIAPGYDSVYDRHRATPVQNYPPKPVRNVGISTAPRWTNSHRQPVRSGQANPGTTDPRFQSSGKRTPQDRFARQESQLAGNGVSQPRGGRPQSAKNSAFLLSGGKVYPRTASREAVRKAPDPTPRAPAQDQRVDPQYFQFQQIGGSTYR